MDWPIQWIILVPVGLITLCAIVLGGLILFAALFERRHVPPLVPMGAPTSRKPCPSLGAALAQEFHDLGCFIEPAGRSRSEMNLLVSPERDVLAATIHGRLARVKLFSKLPDGRWLVTTDAGGEADLSGLAVHELFPTYFPHLLAYHRGRLQRTGLVPLPFELDSAAADLFDQERRRVEAMHAMGLARWRDTPQQSTWSYTLSGAIRASLAGVTGMSEVAEAIRRVKAEGYPEK